MPTPNTHTPIINRTVLMSGADYFAVKELNPYSDEQKQPDAGVAVTEHQAIRSALTGAGVNVIKVDAPQDCQDGVYTANWGLCRGDTAVLSSLPGPRQPEEPFARKLLQGLGKKLVTPPFRFSGQGDALPVGNYLLTGTNYRTDQRVHAFLGQTLGYEVISLQTIPFRDAQGQPVINRLTKWPDSFFYDIDLAISILRPDLIAWCPDAFEPESQTRIRGLKGLDRIEVTRDEAINGFACNLVSTGHTVVMSARAPKLKSDIESRGLTTVTPPITQLLKGGGYIRCTSLTLDND